MSGTKRLMAVVALACVWACGTAFGADEDRPPRREGGDRRFGERGGPPGGGDRGGMRPLAMLEQVQKAIMETATAEQKPKLEPIFAKAREQVQSLQAALEKNEAERREILEKMMAQRNDLRKQLGAILTPEQQQKLQEAGRMGGGDRPGGPGDRGGLRGGDRAATSPFERFGEAMGKLDLTEQQKEKVDKLRTEMTEKFAKMREEFKDDREALGQNMREMFQDIRTRLGEILTAEQKERLQEMMEQGGGRDRRPDRPERPERPQQ